MEFYISPQSGQFYMINVLEYQWLSVTLNLYGSFSPVDGSAWQLRSPISLALILHVLRLQTTIYFSIHLSYEIDYFHGL